jgi:uncharacterized protein
MNAMPVPFQIDAEDVVLLLLEANERVLGRGELAGITRLEKLLFLLEKETRFEGIALLFVFKAHNFGPFSKEVYEAVDFLESCRLVGVREKAHTTIYTRLDEAKLLSEISELEEDPEEAGIVKERIFALTEDGRKVATKIRSMVRREDAEAVDKIIQRYGLLPLSQLIRYVYHQYKDMTVNSIHPEAARVG